MPSALRITAIIAAAGRSDRFGGGDKLAADLGGRSVLLRSVELFARRSDVTSVIVAAPPDQLDAWRERYGPALGFHGAELVEGGRDARWESIARALEHVPGDATHVAVHDAARPGVPEEMIDRLFDAAGHVPAVIPALPVADTVKRVDDREIALADQDDALADAILGGAGPARLAARRVIETLDRRTLMLVQTPQVFEIALLRRAYEGAAEAGATDDAALVERLGEPVHVVPGDQRAMKITTRDDLALLAAVLGAVGLTG